MVSSALADDTVGVVTVDEDVVLTGVGTTHVFPGTSETRHLGETNHSPSPRSRVPSQRRRLETPWRGKGP